MLSEGEKQAIEKFKNIIYTYQDVIDEEDWYSYEEIESAKEYQEVSEKILDILNKQQKEIEELKADKSINTEIHKRDLRIKELEDINEALHQSDKEDFISKDEIKEKLKRKREDINYTYYDFYLDFKELLGEEE